MLENEKMLNEIDDEELNEVAGGGTYTKDGFLKTTAYYTCEHFTCKKCGQVGRHEHVQGYVTQNCCDCKWHTALRCHNPINKR